MDKVGMDNANKFGEGIVKSEIVKGNAKITEFLKSIKPNFKDMTLLKDVGFIKNIFDEVVKSDDNTTETNADIQKVIIESLNKLSDHDNISEEMLEKIINEQIENSKQARESKEKDDIRKDEKIKMLKDWSKKGGVAFVALIVVALLNSGVKIEDVKDVISKT